MRQYLCRNVTLERAFFVLANVFFVVYSFLAVYYYKERCLYADSAYQFFSMLNIETFNIEALRYGVFVTQLLPLLAIKIGLPLRHVLVLYSVSFVVVYYLVFLVCYLKLREKTVAFIIPVTLVAGISVGYYYVVTEIFQALVYLVAFYAWVFARCAGERTSRRRVIDLSVAFIIFLQCFFCHPFAVFPAIFIIGYHALWYKNTRGNELLVLVPLILLVAVVKVACTRANSYEGGLFSNFTRGYSSITQVFDAYPVRYYLSRVFYDVYLTHVVLLAALIVVYLVRKNYAALVLVIPGIVLSWFILSLTFYKGGNDIEIEKVFAPVALLLAIPISRDLLFADHRNRALKIGFFSAIMLVGFSFIVDAGERYERRMSYIEQLVRQVSLSRESKIVVMQRDLQDIAEISWAIPSETLLLSAIEGPGACKTIFVVTSDNILDSLDLARPDIFYPAAFDLRYKYPLNKKYFALEARPYKMADKTFFIENRTRRIVEEFRCPAGGQCVPVGSPGGSSPFTSAFEVDSTREYIFSYKNRLGDVSGEINPALETDLWVLAPDSVKKDQVYVVTTVNGSFYEAHDLSGAITPGRWCNVKVVSSLVSTARDSTVSVYLWNRGKISFLVSKVSISVLE